MTERLIIVIWLITIKVIVLSVALWVGVDYAINKYTLLLFAMAGLVIFLLIVAMKLYINGYFDEKPKRKNLPLLKYKSLQIENKEPYYTWDWKNHTAKLSK